MRPVRTLRNMADVIVRCCAPEQILLFGSYAKEQNNRYSDLDILVVGDFQEPFHLRGGEVRQLLRQRYPIRVDLHFLTPEEVAAEANKPHGFVHSIFESGMVIYRKTE
ncbi:nucleotidyltransferase domain-containing protein [Brevibacillus sp. B_LB10_24]|uniref:nucleotidyltransferase domain-containing protein n=1 Tax=Brevibacillus sp. B_LB10_24 TaxID=3380645 RepID=UPI0038BCBDD0